MKMVISWSKWPDLAAIEKTTIDTQLPRFERIRLIGDFYERSNSSTEIGKFPTLSKNVYAYEQRQTVSLKEVEPTAGIQSVLLIHGLQTWTELYDGPDHDAVINQPPLFNQTRPQLIDVAGSIDALLQYTPALTHSQLDWGEDCWAARAVGIFFLESRAVFSPARCALPLSCWNAK